MWSSGALTDIEKAKDDASKLVVLGSAHRAGIFEALSEERDIGSLKEILNADERALYIILEALYAMGYVNRIGEKYVIADKARPIFLEHGDEYVGGSLPHFMDILGAWLHLPETLKGNKPEKSSGKRDVAAFMNAMAARPGNVVEETVNHCLNRKSDAKKVLDLGGGPGKYARAFVNKGMDVVLYDMPDAIDYVGTHFGLKDITALRLKKGDFTREGFVKELNGESFDIVFMGNICHIYSEDENKKLVRRARELLNNNGMIAIEDFVRGRSPIAEMFAVNMLANTESGNTYTEKQYREWLEVAGFGSIEVKDLDGNENQLITGFPE
ncbi:MAG: methyltransferase [Candidatus Methanoperedens sp.]|jgi:2-polyprenyl-3-methyl-5-hydroxy-6-metoxy-1,4-benzoquinol methylase|nr:methyltransferase [Candidatus Methanoperedens sp.]PKL54021.1 MAG: methyltransferase [Candidatus Methanoperedenaceae archaeon HGW-Methanoperedenaceae-1]